MQAISSILKIRNLQTIKQYLVLLAFILVHQIGFNQQVIEKDRCRVFHSFGIQMTNGMYLPEKLYDEYGLIVRVPRTRYGYEFSINYNCILYKGLGLSADLILWGNIPDGYSLTSKGRINNDTIWFNGFIGDPTTSRPKNGNGPPYWGVNIKVNYTQYICKHLFIQPEIGVKLPISPSYGQEYFEYFCDSNRNNCILYYYADYSNNNTKRKFYPDMYLGINFLVYHKNPKHCIKIGLGYNQGFTTRAEGYYEVRNIGKQYDSGGKVKYGSSHFGFTIGYQFLGLPKQERKKKMIEDNYLFNPMF